MPQLYYKDIELYINIKYLLLLYKLLHVYNKNRPLDSRCQSYKIDPPSRDGGTGRRAGLKIQY